MVKGAGAEALGGVIFKALEELAHKHACFPTDGLDDDAVADILLGMRSAAYHFDDYFTDAADQNKSVAVTVLSSSLSETHADIVDRMALMSGVEMARDLVLSQQTSCIRKSLRIAALRSRQLELRLVFLMKLP